MFAPHVMGSIYLVVAVVWLIAAVTAVRRYRRTVAAGEPLTFANNRAIVVAAWVACVLFVVIGMMDLLRKSSLCESSA